MKQAAFTQTISLLALSIGLSGCATLQDQFASFKKGSVTTPANMNRTVLLSGDTRQTSYDIELYETESLEAETNIPSLVMDGQMKPRPASIELFDLPSMSGFQAVSYANRSAIVQPSSDNYLNAIQLYPYTPGSLYHVYTSPSQVTDIALERGEGLTSVSAGDTDRWTVGDTVSGSGANEQVHILVKPMAAKLSTNAVITTTKRTYYLDLKSFADTYMAAVSWRYPHDAIKQLRSPKRQAPRLQQASIKAAQVKPDSDDYRFDYVIKGDSPNWRPTRVFDDGKKVFIEFPDQLSVSEAPPLFVTEKNGDMKKLVNYRVKGEYYVVDRLFDYAELRLGEKKQSVVRIERAS